MNYVVFDVETKRTFQEAGTTRPGDLGISFVGAYESDTDSYQGFFEDEFDKLWKLFEKADVSVGFNIVKFDLPALGPVMPTEFGNIATLDIYESVFDIVQEERISLNRLAIPTVKMHKKGHGLDAVEYYRKGEKDKLAKYCLQDVKMTKAIYEFGLKNKYLVLLEKTGMLRQIPVNWEDRK
jgi:hypothetical protein